MRLIGDIHGNFEAYKSLIKDCAESIQIGDFGCIDWTIYPEPELKDREVPDIQHGSHKFIRGNHDNPALCKQHPNYLGDFGYLPDKEMFFVSGAHSIDKSDRTIGVDWWDDEQLSYSTLRDVIAKYVEVRPKIMITHCAPDHIKLALLMDKGNNWRSVKTYTEMAFDEMLDIHRPALWVFGHYHTSWKLQEKNTQFVCLNIEETMEI